jgi:hypothetical protein
MGDRNLVESRKRKEAWVRLALDCGAWAVFTAREFV